MSQFLWDTFWDFLTKVIHSIVCTWRGNILVGTYLEEKETRGLVRKEHLENVRSVLKNTEKAEAKHPDQCSQLGEMRQFRMTR